MHNTGYIEWERELAAEKHVKFRGSAIIKLDVLVFDRNVDSTNTERLRDLFRDGGHFRLNSYNHIVAVVDQHSLNTAIEFSGLTADMLLDNSGHYNRLEFPPGLRIDCIHGLDRARAAAESLHPGDQHWVVDLFIKGNALRFSEYS